MHMEGLEEACGAELRDHKYGQGMQFFKFLVVSTQPL